MWELKLNIKTKKKAHLHFSICPSWNFNNHVTNFLKDLVKKKKMNFKHRNVTCSNLMLLHGGQSNYYSPNYMHGLLIDSLGDIPMN